MSEAVRLAVIGDLHDYWDDFDVEHLNGSDYDGVVFVGDLGRGEATSERISHAIGRLERPTLVMPGNADAEHAPRLNAEFSLQRGIDRLFDEAGDEAAPGATDFEGIHLCGYSLHRPGLPGADFTIIAGRPYSLGGPELAFPERLRDSYGVGSVEDSARRLIELVDQAATEALVFVSHNGPLGLGDAPTDPWGTDFLPEATDWGDPDLATAMDHARAQGRRVLAVVAGHMHLAPKGGGPERTWRIRRDGVLFVNPARVPRIGQRDGRAWHHHVSLTIRGDGAEAEEIFVVRPD